MDIAAPARAIGGAHLISRDTNLRVHSFNSASGVTITVVARLLGYDGQPVVCVFDQVPNTDRSIKSTIFALGEGWLVSVQAFASAGTPRRGQCFVRVELVEGLTGAVISLAPLVQGYIQDTTVRAWPGSAIEDSVGGRGVLRSITGTDPAAGAEISETVPTNARWLLLAIRCTLVADATVANRQPVFLFDDGATTVYETPALAVQTASTTNLYSLGDIGQQSTAVTLSRQDIPIPRLALAAGFRIRTTTGNLQAADNWGAPQLLVEELIED